VAVVNFHSRAAAVIADPRVRDAFRIFSDREAEIESDQIRLTLIPAPPFHEQERGRHLADAFRSLGFSPFFDAIGNVIVPYGDSGTNPLVVGAHLDTVFPYDVKLELRITGRVMHLPGIADNGAGLVGLLWLFRAAKEAGLRFRRPLWGVANVGEEGEGDLRGARYLFKTRPWGSGDCEFIAVDGAGTQRILNQALGSRRFRIQMSGPGGHSWTDFGTPNPIHAMAEAIANFVRGGCEPGASFNVGVIEGGIGVNSIARDTTIDVDLRSLSLAALEGLHERLARAMRERASFAGLQLQIESIGERPLGRTSEQSGLVQAALETTRILGADVQLATGSTDANLPMSLGIPAIAIGAGGTGGGTHTPEEWFDPTGRETGLQRLLALVAVQAGLAHL
jgi:acetylornithine deacetylase/succinyl-diaminopimelate desuccinylase-like protein